MQEQTLKKNEPKQNHFLVFEIERKMSTQYEIRVNGETYAIDSTPGEIIRDIRTAGVNAQGWLETVFHVPDAPGSDPNVNIGGTEKTPGDIIRAYYKSVPSGGIRVLNDQEVNTFNMKFSEHFGVPFIGEKGSGALITRSDTTTDDIPTEVPRRQSGARIQRRNGTRNFSIGYSKFGIIEGAKALFRDPDNKPKIIEILQDDTRSHVTTYKNEGKHLCDEVTLNDYPGICAYYIGLTCFYFAVELYYSRGKLMQWVCEKLNVLNVPGKLADDPKFYLPVFITRSQVKTNKITLRLLELLRRYRPFNRSYTDTIDLGQLIYLGEQMDIEIFMYDRTQRDKIRERLVPDEIHCTSKTLIQDDFDGIAKVPIYLHACGEDKVYSKCDRAKTMALVISQSFSAVKHCEPELDFNTVRKIVSRRTNFVDAKVKIRYEGYNGTPGVNDNFAGDYMLFNDYIECETKPVENPFQSMYQRGGSGIDIPKAMFLQLDPTLNISNYTQYYHWKQNFLRQIEIFQVMRDGYTYDMEKAQDHEKRVSVIKDYEKYIGSFKKDFYSQVNLLPGFFQDHGCKQYLRAGEGTVTVQHVLGDLLNEFKLFTGVALIDFEPLMSPKSLLQVMLEDCEVYKGKPNTMHGLLSFKVRLTGAGGGLQEVAGANPSITISRHAGRVAQAGKHLVKYAPYKTKFLDAYEHMKDEIKKSCMQGEGSEEEKLERLEKRLDRLSKTAKLEHVGDALLTVNPFVDYLLKLSKKKDSFTSAIRRVFPEIDPPELESMKVYEPCISETPIPVAVDSTAWRARPDRMAKMLLVDMSKDYLVAACGHNNTVIKPDLFGHTANFCGMHNPKLERFEIDEDEKTSVLLSHIADCGRVRINLNVDKIKPRHQKFFRPTSPWMRFKDHPRYVWTAVVIDLCQRILEMEQENDLPRGHEHGVYRYVQTEVLGIQEGYFDFSAETRTIIKKYLFKSKNSVDYIPLGDEVKAALRKRIILPNTNTRFDVTPNGVTFRNQVYGKDSISVAQRRARNISNAFVNAIYHFVMRLPEKVEYASQYEGVSEKIERKKLINNYIRNMIGASKYLVPGAVAMKSTSDILESDPVPREESEPVKKRIRLDKESQETTRTGPRQFTVDTLPFEMGESGIPYVLSIPGHGDKVLVSSCKANAIVSRGSFAPWRDMILALKFCMMNEIVSICDPVRVRTDSVVIEPEKLPELETYLEKVLWKHPEEESEFLIPGYFRGWTVNELDFENPDDEANKVLRDLESGLAPIPAPIHPRVEEIRKGAFEPRKILLDSELFLEFCRAQGVAEAEELNGIDLHHSLRQRAGDQDVIKLYEGYTEFRAEYIISLGGCLMIGEPGAGKSTCCRKMIELFKKKFQYDNEIAITATMHSILRGFRDFSDKNIVVGTLHSLLGVDISVASLAYNAQSHLENYLNGRGKKYQGLKVLFVDEIEVVSKSFEEFIKYLYEKHGVITFLVGDPHQTTCLFGRGFDLNGSVVKTVCSNTEFRFDLQFRNQDPGYLYLVNRAIENGEVSLYTDPDMGPYFTSFEDHKGKDPAVEKVDEVIDLITEQMYGCLIGTHSEIEWTVMCQSYKSIGMIWLEVYRRLFSVGGISNAIDMVLVRTGCIQGSRVSSKEVIDEDEEVEESSFRGKQSDTNVDDFRLLTSHRSKVKGRFWENGGKNKRPVQMEKKTPQTGPVGRNFLVGLPLVFYTGATFVSTNRFVSKYYETKQPSELDLQYCKISGETPKPKIKTFTVEQQAVYRYMGERTHIFDIESPFFEKTPGGKKVQQKPQRRRVKVMHFAPSWEDPDDEDQWIKMTEMEAAMYLMPSFVVLNTFSVGATLNKLMVLQVSVAADFSNRYRNTYRPIKDELEEHERILGPLASRTALARSMCVARTRVRDPSDCLVVDMEDSKMDFWRKDWNSCSYLTMDTDKVDEETHRKVYANMRLSILLGKMKFKKVNAKYVKASIRELIELDKDALGPMTFSSFPYHKTNM